MHRTDQCDGRIPVRQCAEEFTEGARRLAYVLPDATVVDWNPGQGKSRLAELHKVSGVQCPPLLRSTRQQYHLRIAQVVEAQFADVAETQPELLAHHYSEAGLTAQALPYYWLAGAKAVARASVASCLPDRGLGCWPSARGT